MRNYELMSIFPCEEDKWKPSLELLKSVLTEFGVQIIKEEPFDERDLTFEVKGYKRGKFVLFTIKANPDKISEIDKRFKLNENLLKYLFVKKDSKQEI